MRIGRPCPDRLQRPPPTQVHLPERQTCPESAEPGLTLYAKEAGCRERVKGVLDAATGVVYLDDSQVAPPDCAEAHSGPGSGPYVVLESRSCLTRVLEPVCQNRLTNLDAKMIIVRTYDLAR